jgi:hypothetical protein
MPLPLLPNGLWAPNFASEQLVSSRRFRTQAIYDAQLCPVAIADTSLSGLAGG